MTNRRRGSDVVSKEVITSHVEPGVRLAQVVARMTDTVGAVASVNALLASLKVDVQIGSINKPTGQSKYL